MSPFCDPTTQHADVWNHLIRFTFCKRDDTPRSDQTACGAKQWANYCLLPPTNALHDPAAQPLRPGPQYQIALSLLSHRKPVAGATHPLHHSFSSCDGSVSISTLFSGGNDLVIDVQKCRRMRGIVVIERVHGR